MNKYTRALMVGVGAVLALGTFTACSSGTTEQAATTTETTTAATTTAAAMPEMADFIAEVQKPDGSTMTMAIAVEGENVVAYATNGTNNEAYFFGTQKDGQMELMSMYADEVKASFDGSNINGEMAMNDEGATVQKFAATRVQAPAGMYTAARGNSRATWIVRPNNTTVGVMDNSAPGDHKVTDANAAKDQAFKDSVRQKRQDRQLQQAPQLQMDTMEADMNGSMMPVTRVTGSMSSDREGIDRRRASDRIDELARRRARPAGR